MIAISACLAVLGFISVANLLLTVALAQRLKAAQPGSTMLDDLRDQAQVDSAIPEFSALTMSGIPLNSSEFVSGTAIFAFFSTDCAGCRDAMPDFANRVLQIDGKVLTVITGDATSAQELAAPLRDTTTDVIVGSQGTGVQAAFGVTIFPTFSQTVQGRIRTVSHGYGQFRMTLAST